MSGTGVSTTEPLGGRTDDRADVPQDAEQAEGDLVSGSRRLRHSGQAVGDEQPDRRSPPARWPGARLSVGWKRGSSAGRRVPAIASSRQQLVLAPGEWDPSPVEGCGDGGERGCRLGARRARRPHRQRAASTAPAARSDNRPRRTTRSRLRRQWPVRQDAERMAMAANQVMPAMSQPGGQRGRIGAAS